MIKFWKHVGMPVLCSCSLLLAGCSEELIKQVKGDPEPETKSGEENANVDDLLNAAGLTVAKYSTTDGLVPLPNDLILSSVNASVVAGGGTAFNGMSSEIPIRIPFTASIDVPTFDYSSAAGQAAAVAWAQNIVIVSLGPTDEASAGGVAAEQIAPFLALPQHDRNLNSISAAPGNFKTVLQDANNDLVLVPNVDTFKDGWKYAVIVKKGLKTDLIEDTLFTILKSDDALFKGSEVTNTILLGQGTDLATAKSLDELRIGYKAVMSAAGIAENDVAVMQTFKTTYTDTATATTSAINSGNMRTAAYSWANAAATVINWTTTTGTSTDSDNAEDKKATVYKGVTANYTNLSKVLHGSYACQNFLRNTGTSAIPNWKMDLATTQGAANTACPNLSESTNGTMQFWLAVPTNAVKGVVMFQHGITRSKDDAFAVANRLASKGYATIAIDEWGHGSRTYEDSNSDNSIDATIDSGKRFNRPDNPALTTGYVIQSQMDMIKLSVMTKTNASLLKPLGISNVALSNATSLTTVYNATSSSADLSGLATAKLLNTASPTLNFVGQSLGGILGSNIAASGTEVSALAAGALAPLTGLIGAVSVGDKIPTIPFKRIVLNTPGGDLTDIINNGSKFGPEIRAAVAAANGLANPSNDLNRTMLGVELSSSHAVFTGTADSLSNANTTFPTSVLMQEITGDQVISNSNSELMAHSMGLKKISDGNGVQTTVDGRTQWVLDPGNYSAIGSSGSTAGHEFLLDGTTTATEQGQMQAICYLDTGIVLDPKMTITTNCTQ